MQATDLHAFHRWLLGDDASGAPSIAIHGDNRIPANLASAVARHLNEFDEDACGKWLSFTPELIERISASSVQRSLLGLGDDCPRRAGTTECRRDLETLAGLASHGHAVLEGAPAVDACSNRDNVFQVWLGHPPNQAATVHLTLQPESFHGSSLAGIIGDTFLEWSHARLPGPAG